MKKKLLTQAESGAPVSELYELAYLNIGLMLSTKPIVLWHHPRIYIYKKCRVE